MAASIPPALLQAFKRQKYHLIGSHSAVKSCRWLHETLVHDRPCYKQKFHGIKTHQCIQMSPAAFNCTQQCLFCWRAQNKDLGIAWDEMKLPQWDTPEEIVEGSIRAQRAITSGYKANAKVNKQKHKEAQTPRHAAISLTGEPTLYQPIDELISVFKRRGFTTFLVTNGTTPSTLAKLETEPTQLYISVCAPDEQTFKRICRPQIDDAWKKLNETLALLPSFRCSTVIRITSVHGLNMENGGGYAKLIEKADPTYVEPKAYMHVGFSRLRLDYGKTPEHSEIGSFAERLAHESGYRVIDESEDSRVALLSKLQKPNKLSDG